MSIESNAKRAQCFAKVFDVVVDGKKRQLLVQATEIEGTEEPAVTFTTWSAGGETLTANVKFSPNKDTEAEWDKSEAAAYSYFTSIDQDKANTMAAEIIPTLESLSS